VMSAIADGRYEQVGTFNGNPLAMAATKATLTEVLTPQGYDHLDDLASRLRASLESTIAEYGFDWHVVTAGAKGCVTFRRERVREFRDFLQIDARGDVEGIQLSHAERGAGSGKREAGNEKRETGTEAASYRPLHPITGRARPA
ncbi:MAG TPA: hypothetical protein VD758_02215, partial [Gemmatimonadaceae bacterium]|nr:hypothetical protein [Gemmatimonadaceae bacterium]